MNLFSFTDPRFDLAQEDEIEFDIAKSYLMNCIRYADNYPEDNVPDEVLVWREWLPHDQARLYQRMVERVLISIKIECNFTAKQFEMAANYGRVVKNAVAGCCNRANLYFPIRAKCSTVLKDGLPFDANLVITTAICPNIQCKLPHKELEEDRFPEKCRDCESDLLNNDKRPRETFARITIFTHLRLQLQDEAFCQCIQNPPVPTAGSSGAVKSLRKARMLT